MRFLLFPVLALFALAGCETVGGFGQDVETAGEVIQETSSDVQRSGF